MTRAKRTERAPSSEIPAVTVRVPQETTTRREHLLTPERLENERREDEARIETIEKAIKAPPRERETPKPFTPEERETYIEKNLPEHLKSIPGKPSLGARAFGLMMRAKDFFVRKKVDGREHIPEKGPYLIVSNHSGGETGALLGLFRDRALRIAAGRELNWKRSGLRSWLLKKLGMLAVNETLSNLTEEEKQSLLTRVRGKAQRKAYGEIVEREKDGRMTPNNDFLRSALAALLQGDAVAVFPEGLFLYDGNRTLRKGYGGLELIAQRYKKMTGQELPILPVGISTKTVGIGKALRLSEKTGDVSDTDWVMTELAKQLPEHERGMYRE